MVHPIAHAINEPDASRPAKGAWLSLSLLLAINLFNYVDRQVLAAVEPLIHRTFPNESKTKMGLLATVFLLSYMLFAPVFGRLADRSSRWLLVGIGVLIWSAASGASGLAHVFILLMITRCFVGIGEAAYGPVAPSIISDLYPVKSRGLVLSMFYVAIPVGSALGYVLGDVVGTKYGWRRAFYAVVPPGVLLGLIALFMKDRRSPRAAATGGTHRNVRQDYFTALKTPSYLLDTIGMTAMTFAIGGIGFWMPSYITIDRKYSDLGTVNFTFGVITVIAGLLATVLGGIAGDLLRPRFSGSYFLVSGAGLIAGFVFFLAMLFVPFPAAWILIFLAVFCLFFNTGPSNTILANVTHPAIRASAFALNILIIHLLGDAISPPVIGWLSERYGANVAFGCVSVMMLVGGLVWLAGAKYLKADTERAERDEPEPGRGFPVIMPTT